MAKILQKTCLVCGKSFNKPLTESFKNWFNRRKYCSEICRDKAPRSKATRLKQRLVKLGKPSWNKGLKLSEIHKQHLRKKHKPLSEETKAKMRGRRPWNKIGDGITPINEKIRKSLKYKKWRKKVFKKDNYTCQLCGKREKNLQADHIKPFALYPKLRFKVSNGRTLCINCHQKTETYGLNQHTSTNAA